MPKACIFSRSETPLPLHWLQLWTCSRLVFCRFYILNWCGLALHLCPHSLFWNGTPVCPVSLKHFWNRHLPTPCALERPIGCCILPSAQRSPRGLESQQEEAGLWIRLALQQTLRPLNQPHYLSGPISSFSPLTSLFFVSGTCQAYRCHWILAPLSTQKPHAPFCFLFSTLICHVLTEVFLDHPLYNRKPSSSPYSHCFFLGTSRDPPYFDS